ncbi:MAG: glycosyltransferase family 1 protein [Acidimicrobiales bacterium]
MRVALDVSAVPPRLAGAGRYVAELARRLPCSDVDTTLVTRRDDALRWHEWSPSSTITSAVPNARGTRLLYEAWILGAGAAAKSVDVWHAPHYTMPRRRTRPTVVTIHDLTFFTNPEWHERTKVTFFRRAITYAARHADVLLSVSEFTARQLDILLPQHAPMVVAPHGVDLERFATDAARDDELLMAHHLPNDVPYLFFLGTIEPRKGLDVLVTAFEELAAANPSLELWVAGQTGWGVTLDALSAQGATAARIRRLDFVADAVLPALLRHSRAVVYPSRGEGFGLPVLEAMACGAVVVTSSDTVMSDVARDTAFLSPPGDAALLAEAIQAALNLGDEDRAKRGRLARQRAELFTWDSSVSQHVKAYEMARES